MSNPKKVFSSPTLIPKSKEVLPSSSGGGNGGNNNMSLEARLARMEAHIEHIDSELVEIKQDIRDIKQDIGGIHSTLMAMNLDFNIKHGYSNFMPWASGKLLLQLMVLVCRRM